MSPNLKLSTVLAACLLSACASIPTGPSVMALPGSNKNFDQFRFDDADCRYYASGQLDGKTAEQGQTDSVVKSAVLGTVVGAVAGAAMGGHQGAGAGAGMGLVVGTVAGAGAGESSGYHSQRRYDNAYVQCMYAKGHSVPVAGRQVSAPSTYAPATYAPAPQPSAPTIPPPPYGNPPPPPPGVR